VYPAVSKIASKHHRLRKFLGIFFVAVVVFALLTYLGAFSMSEEYSTFTRPDGKYRVVVSKNTTLLNLKPSIGGSSDAPGVVRLYDQRGKLLQEAKVDMVQQVENVEWPPKGVYIKLVADWSLPD
jgi:hypothetical protein